MEGESSFCSALPSMVTASDDLAVRILRHPLAGASRRPLAMGPGGRSAYAVWTDAERICDPVQRGYDASHWNALCLSSCEPAMESCDDRDADAASGGSSAVGLVQRRRSRYHFRRSHRSYAVYVSEV